MPIAAASPAAPAPSSLPSPALARRLADLCGDERNLLVDFLLYLSEFDSREAWAAAGYGSLWAWCTEVLHLREGATARRIGAMKLLRRFPSLEAPLRDGRLCLTTLNELGPLLDESNVDGLVAQAAFLSKADTKRLVVAIKPVDAPRDGIRKLPVRAAGANVVSGAVPASPVAGAEGPAAPGLAVPGAPGLAAPAAAGAAASAQGSSSPLPSPAALPGPLPLPTPRGLEAPRTLRADVRPVSASTYSLHVTLDETAKAELDQLVSLLSHKTGGNLAATLREAVRCGIAKHGKRKGAVAPERKRAARASKPARPVSEQAAPLGPVAKRAEPVGADPEPERESSDPRYIPMEVKRIVWDRDGGRCAWTSPDGKRCGSRHQLEFGHIRPVALGGKSTTENIRLECKRHNRFEADRVFGRAHMETFRGRGTASSGSNPR